MSDKQEKQEKRVLIFWGALIGGFLVWYNGDWFRCLTDHWVYLELLKWQRGFGALLGLGAILLGAMFNAKLNRARDDRIREEERRSIAAAFSAEIKSIVQRDQHTVEVLEDAIATAEKLNRNTVSSMGMKLHALSKDRTIYKELSAQLGKLDSQVARRVTAFYQHTRRSEMTTAELVNTDDSVLIDIVKEAASSIKSAIKHGDKISKDLLIFAEAGCMPQLDTSSIAAKGTKAT